jgi:hypothetical protein
MQMWAGTAIAVVLLAVLPADAPTTGPQPSFIMAIENFVSDVINGFDQVTGMLAQSLTANPPGHGSSPAPPINAASSAGSPQMASTSPPPGDIAPIDTVNAPSSLIQWLAIPALLALAQAQPDQYATSYSLSQGAVYYTDPTSPTFNTLPLLDADPSTFVGSTVDPTDAKDKDAVYCNGQLLQGADPATFAVLSAIPAGNAGVVNSYAKDRLHAYLDCAIIPDADPSTFEVVGDPTPGYVYYAKDKNHVYFCDEDCNLPDGGLSNLVVIAEADAATFNLVGTYVNSVANNSPLPLSGPLSYYAEDKNHLYEGSNVIAGADPHSSTLLCFDQLITDTGTCVAIRATYPFLPSGYDPLPDF